MRDRAWNVARVQYTETKHRVARILRRDWQRQERERLWDEAHPWYVSQNGNTPTGSEACSSCVIRAELRVQNQQYTKPSISRTTTWWERDGALVEDELVVPETPRCGGKMPHLPQPQARTPSHLADSIKSWRSMKALSDEQNRVWEDRHRLERAIRQKYDLPDEYVVDPELFESPIPASHARHHYRQLLTGRHAAERRAIRRKRRAEGFRPSRSLLAISELVNDVEMDEAEREKMRQEEEAVALRRITDVVATEVGYLYFVGELGLLERWRDDFEASDLDLVQRQTDNSVYVGHVEEEHVGIEVEMEL